MSPLSTATPRDPAAVVGCAHDCGDAVIDMGFRDRGLSELLVDSCESAPARATTAPVLLVPSARGNVSSSSSPTAAASVRSALMVHR